MKSDQYAKDQALKFQGQFNIEDANMVAWVEEAIKEARKLGHHEECVTELEALE